jgi:hypothetical protein
MSKNTKKDFVSVIETNRSTLLELVLVAVLISLAVNLLAASLSAHLSRRNDVIAAIVILAVALAYLWISRLGDLAGEFEYTGFLVYDIAEQRFLRIEEYDLSEKSSSFLDAALAEDENLRTLWTRNPLSTSVDESFNIEKVDHSAQPGQRSSREDGIVQIQFGPAVAIGLVVELLEYVCLDWLSVHLTDFFNRDNFERTKLRDYRREDIPDILMQNRFLELFSRPMAQRAAFLRQEPSDTRAFLDFLIGGRVEPIATYLASGVTYQRFDLTVPRGSTLQKSVDGGFTVKGPLITVVVRPTFSGYSATLPGSFLRSYVGRQENRDEIRAFKVEIGFSYRINWRGVFMQKGWDYHRWAESFAKVLEQKTDGELFFSAIGWSTVQTWLECAKRTSQNKN